jgi:preprotein translocase subunit YajC
MTTGNWIALVVFLVAVMMTLTFATVRMQGKSAKDKRQEQKRSAAMKLAE